MAAGRCRIEAMDQPFRNTNCLKFLLKCFVKLVEPFRDFQCVVFFSP
jgi:hypothetical protein